MLARPKFIFTTSGAPAQPAIPHSGPRDPEATRKVLDEIVTKLPEFPRPSKARMFDGPNYNAFTGRMTNPVAEADAVLARLRSERHPRGEHL